MAQIKPEEAGQELQKAFVPETEEQKTALAGVMKEFGLKEMDTSKAPALPTVAGDVTAGGVGATTAGTATIADLQKRIEELATAKPSAEVEEQKKSILDLITKREKVKEAQKPAAELRQEALTQAYKEMGVTPEQIQKIGGLIGQITTYNQQLADIEVRKQAALTAIEDRPGMDLAFMGGEQNRITKAYNSEISAKGVMAAVKVQELQMLQGAYTDAKNTAAQIVNLMTYDQQQIVADIEWSLNAHQDLYNLLSGEEQTAWNRQYTQAKDELARMTTEETNKQNLIIDAANKGVNLSNLTTSSLEEIQKAYTEQVSAVAAERAPVTPEAELLSVSEAKSLGVPYGTTKAQAIEMGKVPTEIPAPPEYITSFKAYSDAGWTRDQVESSWISQYNQGKPAGVQIKNKAEMEKNFPEIKASLDEVYGKAPGAWEKVKTWWGGLWGK